MIRRESGLGGSADIDSAAGSLSDGVPTECRSAESSRIESGRADDSRMEGSPAEGSPEERSSVGSHAASEDITILVHGIWMQGSLMRVMARMLGSRGFRTHTVSYDFLKKSPAENAQLLLREIATLGVARINLVGHSLGGIVILHLLEQEPELAVNRVVLIGSPVNGSSFARRIHKIRWLRPLLGRSVEQGLLGGAPGFASERPLGIITGKLPFRMPSFLTASQGGTDGVVLEHETLIDSASDHISLPFTHSTIIFTRRCSDYVGNFLETGSFKS